MAQVYLGLGSNKNAATHIPRAVVALRTQFGELVISPVYESESVGFRGANFLNLVVGITTHLRPMELLLELRAIESANGRDRCAPKYSGRTLDIDILLYDNCVGELDGITLPRAEILQNAFVLQPLFDLIPAYVHPLQNKTIAELWAAYPKHRQHLWQVAFDWSVLPESADCTETNPFN